MAPSPIQRANLKQYFTDAYEVNSAMANLLGDVTGLSLLEPSVGGGALLSGLQGRPAHIDAVDVDVTVLALTKQRFPKLPLNAVKADFIDMFVDGPMLAGLSPLKRQYDAVISNPPFGLFFDPEYRKRLKSAYPFLYVRESYGPLSCFLADVAAPRRTIRFSSSRYLFD